MIDGPVVVRRWVVPIPTLPAQANGIRLAHISDLHFHKWSRALAHAQTLLLGLEYDVLAVTGNFCDRRGGWAGAADLCRRFFAPLDPEGGVLAVLGDRDPACMTAQTDLGLKFLRNTTAWATVRGARLLFAGIEQGWDAPADVAAALSRVPNEQAAIMLAHYPSTVHQLPARRIALVLAGHTRGGQVRLPLVGCLWANDRIPARMARGLHVVGGRALHVSAGLGVPSNFPVRFCCPPEITILTLAAAGAAPVQRFTVAARRTWRRKAEPAVPV